MREQRVTHPRIETRPPGGVRPWWAKAWMRAVEEAAFTQQDLKLGNRLARAGMVGAITIEPGSVLAAVRDGDDAWTVTVALPVLDEAAVAAFAEVVAAASRRLADLLAGDLPHQIVEDAEEAGVELLPYGGELAATCSCGVPLDPCPHALAVLVQLAWLQAEDASVLLLLRGIARDDLVQRVQALTSPGRGAGDTGVDLGVVVGVDVDVVDIATDAALRAARLLVEWG